MSSIVFSRGEVAHIMEDLGEILHNCLVLWLEKHKGQAKITEVTVCNTMTSLANSSHIWSINGFSVLTFRKNKVSIDWKSILTFCTGKRPGNNNELWAFYDVRPLVKWLLKLMNVDRAKIDEIYEPFNLFFHHTGENEDDALSRGIVIDDITYTMEKICEYTIDALDRMEHCTIQDSLKTATMRIVDSCRGATYDSATKIIEVEADDQNGYKMKIIEPSAQHIPRISMKNVTGVVAKYFLSLNVKEQEVSAHAIDNDVWITKIDNSRITHEYYNCQQQVSIRRCRRAREGATFKSWRCNPHVVLRTNNENNIELNRHLLSFCIVVYHGYHQLQGFSSLLDVMEQWTAVCDDIPNELNRGSTSFKRMLHLKKRLCIYVNDFCLSSPFLVCSYKIALHPCFQISNNQQMKPNHQTNVVVCRSTTA